MSTKNPENFRERLKEFRTRNGISQAAMGELLGISGDYVYQIEAGLRQPGSSLNLLFDLVEHKDKLQDGKYGKESNVGGLVELRMIPVYSFVQAGEATDFQMLPDDWQETVPYAGKAKNVFALTVRGDSMEPKFSPGDVVIVNAERPAKNGSLVVANLKNQGVIFKMMHHTGDLKRIRLTSYNSGVYPPLDIAREELHWMYPVDQSVTRFNL